LNNNAQTTTTVNRVADLAITKTDQPDPVIVGNNITYELTVTNKGPSPANNMVVTDTLPSGVIFVAATSPQGICTRAGSIVTCNLPGPLALNAQATVRIVVTSTRVDPRLTNTATVTSSDTDLDLSNNLATADTMVISLPPTGAELVITMQDSSDPAIVGSPLTYTITVLNSGPDSATNVVVTDTLPASVTFNSASPSQGNCVQTSGTVTCNLGTMARNGQAIIPLTVTPRAAGIITNKTSVTSTAANDNPANNSAEERTVVNEADSDLDGINDAVEDGAPNSGDGNRDGIADRLQENVSSLPNGVDGSYVTLFSPATTRLVDVRAVENPSPADAPPRVEFPVGFFAFVVQGVVPGGTTTLTLFLPSGVEVDTYYKFGPTPDDPSDHWYEFLFDGTTGAEILADRVILHFVDGQRGDDDLSANGAVMEPGAPARQTGVDLALNISNTPNPVKVGQTLTYTGVVTNNGPEVATGVTLTDTLPAGVTFLTVTSTQGSCVEASGMVTCTVGTIPSGAIVTVTINVTPTQVGFLSNIASVASSVVDTDTTNNSVTQDTVVNRFAFDEVGGEGGGHGSGGCVMRPGAQGDFTLMGSVALILVCLVWRHLARRGVRR